jgi:hypothetical protein
MRKYLITILILLLIAPQAFAFTYVSPDIFKGKIRRAFDKFLECRFSISCYRNLGAFTDLNSTDNLSDFPTTYNANLDKTIEVGTTSVKSITTLENLVTVGTIGTGVWQGTEVDVAYGGTGSTTLSANQVLLGNGTGDIKTVVGYGTSGQFLTSAGNDAIPTWTTSSINEALSYNFTGSIFNVKNLHASGTAANPITLNGVAYDLPTADGASSTALMTDGSGGLTWNYPQPKILVSDTTARTHTGSTASTTVYTYTFTPSEIINSSIVNIHAFSVHSAIGSANQGSAIKIGNGSSTTTLSADFGISANNFHEHKIRIVSKDSTSAQSYTSRIVNTNTDVEQFINGVLSQDFTSNVYLAFEIKLVDGSDTSGFQGITVEKY